LRQPGANPIRGAVSLKPRVNAQAIDAAHVTERPVADLPRSDLGSRIAWVSSLKNQGCADHIRAPMQQ